MSNNRYDTGAVSQMKSDQAARIRALEIENEMLKREVAILTVDKLVLREIADENDRGGTRESFPGR
jgi:hypothetical protein